MIGFSTLPVIIFLFKLLVMVKKRKGLERGEIKGVRFMYMHIHTYSKDIQHTLCLQRLLAIC